MIPSIAGRIKQSHSEYNVELFLQPFTQYHLYNLGFGGGAIERVRLFAIIAFFIFMIKSSSEGESLDPRDFIGASA
jgi:hypothetical protein